MSKVMETTSLSALLERMAGELAAKGTIYEVPERAFLAAFAAEAGSPGLEVMSGRASLPVGPAAGPHSQIAPNLVAAYLAGARVFELKTVQEKDRLDIEKPCIEALDEGHNAEWSTELSLEEAREEYLRGWIAVNLLAAVYSKAPRSFIFNVSVGYTLAGIMGARVDAYIEGMRKPFRSSFWGKAMRDLAAFVEGPSFRKAFCERRDGAGSAAGAAWAGAPAGALERARALVADFPASPVHSVTLSTMHGCPPDEIERIGAYLIEEKGFDTYVKLNPTLLGYDAARGILDATGWTGIGLKRETFEHDLQFKDALNLVRSLSGKAEENGRRFGIKLSNTLANANTGGFLPGGERYMSGRALFPITVRLAADLAAALPEFAQRFSYCGGASALNVADLLKAGVGPITVATDLLKPGGYQRLGDMARAAAAALPGSPSRPDPAALAALAKAALERPEYRKEWKAGRASISRSLPVFDCFAAPCVEACPVHQKAPAYIRLAGSGSAREATATILADNPLPHITGVLCDHVCQEACCRNDYEGSVEIRASKLGCVRASAPPAPPLPPSPSSGGKGAAFRGKVAVIGAGPAGLSCAYHLALAGIPAALFDASAEPGGVPANVLPRFRIERADLAKDIDRITSLGVERRFGVEVRSLDKLKAEGFTAFFAASGAPVPRELPLSGSGPKVVDALEFLAEARALADPGAAPGAEAAREAGAALFAGAKRVVIAGGGNTAMDAARVALKIPGVKEVLLSYRRTRAEMPADKEELGNALAEGAKLMELSLPESAVPASGGAPAKLVLRIMELGDPDRSGRRSPRPSAETMMVDCDLLVAAIGEVADRRLLEGLGVAFDSSGRPVYDRETQAAGQAGLYVGGDAASGPSSIIAAAADGRRAAYAIMRSAGIEPPASDYAPPEPDPAKREARGRILPALPAGSADFARREAERCLACDSACLRCVEVCPNRANVALPVAKGGGLAQSLQIVHVDALCNECGNCGMFCPYEGEPYRHKPTLFGDRAALEASKNPGFAFAETPTGGSGTPAGGARLAYRAAYAGPAGEADEAASPEPMAVLARTLRRDHPYLLGGAR